MGEYDAIAAGFPDPYRMIWRESVGSTNDELRALADYGAAEGLIFVAEAQSAGRGRRGAKWESEAGLDLSFSVLLRPKFEKKLWGRLSLVAGLAVCEAMEAWDLEAEIKWPNDVWCGKRKLAGILVETVRDFVVIGIGVNVNSLRKGEPLAAVSVCDLYGNPVSRAEVLGRIIARLAERAAQSGEDFHQIVESAKTRCALRGHRISFQSSGREQRGLCEGIGPEGELIVLIGEKRISHKQISEVRLID